MLHVTMFSMRVSRISPEATLSLGYAHASLFLLFYSICFLNKELVFPTLVATLKHLATAVNPRVSVSLIKEITRELERS